MAITQLLQDIEEEIKGNITQYEGSPFVSKYIHEVFLDNIPVKVPTVGESSRDRLYGQKDLISDKSWYVYDANYGTKEERLFVEMFSRRFEYLDQHWTNIYLIRNERKLAIFNKMGQRFEPDFVLFARKKDYKELIYQVFVEPKGQHLKLHDRWKEEFLLEIKGKAQVFSIESDKYILTAVPFYNNEDEKEFRESLEGLFQS